MTAISLPQLRVVPELARQVRIGQVGARPAKVRESEPALQQEIDDHCTRLRQAHSGHKPSEIPGLRPARELYRIFGIDPTKTRPSSEALARRALLGKAMPRISNAVDLGNLMALRFLLPIGLYDAERIDGPVVLRRGGSGEAYEGVSKDVVHLEGRPVLADLEGPFGNPTADSARTAVRDSTTRLWMVVFAPASFPADRLERNLLLARDGMARHLGADESLVTLDVGMASRSSVQ